MPNAVSVGAAASGEGAAIVVDTVFGSVLHEGTQTITASGSIVLTVDGGYAEFRTAWLGDDGAGAGFVHIHCEQQPLAHRSASRRVSKLPA